MLVPVPVQVHLFADDGTFPNSRLPVLVYPAAVPLVGPQGKSLDVQAGDVLVIPAKTLGASSDSASDTNRRHLFVADARDGTW